MLYIGNKDVAKHKTDRKKPPAFTKLSGGEDTQQTKQIFTIVNGDNCYGGKTNVKTEERIKWTGKASFSY